MRIRYFGHMGERTGYGVAAEHYCRALEQAGVDVERAPFTNAGVITSRGAPDVVYADEIDAVIVHTLPLDCERVIDGLTFIEKTGGDSRPSPPCVAYTTWEALTIDHDISLYLQQAFDEVWVPSEASARPFREQPDPGEEPNVHVIPHCFPEAEILKAVRFTNLRGNAPFRFYWSGAWTARKNPGGLIRAYCHAFRPNYPGYEGDVEFFLHSHGTPVDALAAELAATGIPQGDLPRIRFNNEYLDDDTMRELHARGDCFVSAARGEAWNLPCFDALVHGNHIVTTEGLGSDDYLGGTSAQRVNATKVPAWNTIVRGARMGAAAGAELVGAQGLTSRDLWLEPDLVRFGKSMRRVHDVWTRGTRKIENPFNLGERYGYAAVAQQILTRLENLCR